MTRHRPDGWDDPDNVGCNVNSAADEASPVPREGEGPVLLERPARRVRARGGRRDDREIFFFSNRPGTLGMADIYAATRASAFDPWSAPLNLGPDVNSRDGAETRPSLSWDGTTLYFGSSRVGGERSTDHYVTTRSRD